MSKPPPVPVPIVTPILDADVVVEDDRWRQYPRIEDIVATAAQVLVTLDPTLFAAASAVTVMLSDDARVMALNTNFRNKPTPTNVLSFPAAAGANEPGESVYLGDIIIARETVEREAEESGIPVPHHVQHLTIHGVLHLLGFDHQTDAEAERMEDMETRALRSIGVADPYAATEPTTQN